MSYVNNIAGSIDNINTVGEIESITTNGNVTTITATAQIVSSNVIGRLGFAQVNISSEVKDVLVNGESVLDEQGNANIEIPEIEEIDPTVPKHIKGITEENIENWNNKSNFSGNYEDLNNKPELFSGDYNDLENKPKLPNKTSDLYNDSGYITAEDIPEFPEIPEIPQPIEYKADDNIIIEDETIKGYTNTGYKVIDEDIKLQDITPTRTTGTNKQVYTDAEISIIYDGSNKIRRAVNGIDFDVISLSYTCKSMFYNPNIKRIYGLANGYFLYSDDNGETWNTKQSTYANGSDYITQAQPHVSGLTAVNKSTKTLYGLGDNFIQNSSIKSTISPDFVTQFSQYQFIWCNSSGTFKYGAGSQEGTFASLSGVTVNMLKTVNGRQIVGVKNSNKFYMIKNLSGVTGNEWIPYDLPNVCTVNDIIFNPYDETYYIFTDVNTYYKTKDLTNPDSFESVDKDGLRGVQGHFTLMGIQMTTTEHDKLLLAPTRTKIENKLQEHDRDLDKSRWVGKGLKLTEEGKVNVKSNTDKIGVNDYGLYLGIIDQNNLSEDVIEALYVAKATIKPMSPYELEEWYWGEGYPQDDNYACQKIVFTEAGSFIDQVNWEDETFVEEGELGYLFCDQNQTIFKYVKICNLNWFK